MSNEYFCLFDRKLSQKNIFLPIFLSLYIFKSILTYLNEYSYKFVHIIFKKRKFLLGKSSFKNISPGLDTLKITWKILLCHMHVNVVDQIVSLHGLG